MTMQKYIVLFVSTVVLATVVLLVYRQNINQSESVVESSNNHTTKQITVVADQLDTPWAITTLPDMSLLLSERSGVIRLIGSNNRQFQIADVVEEGEGGLLGVAVNGDFQTNNYVYVYKTTGPENIVERYQLINNQLTQRTDVLTAIPAASNHNGGAIAFGPDGKLYITTGDAQEPNLSQVRGSLAGKILRISADGSVPADNPFGNAVWSYGHRNPQGLVWDDQGRLWSTEHGPSGSGTGNDELNLIRRGGNYGWPAIRGQQERAGMIKPVAESGANETWAPAGLAYSKGNLYFNGLRAETLYKARIQGESVELSRHLVSEYGRLRAITTEADSLLIGTSNRDGRGMSREGDDKIIRVPLSTLD